MDHKIIAWSIQLALGDKLDLAVVSKFYRVIKQLAGHIAEFASITMGHAEIGSDRADDLVIHIVDTGIGIASDQIANLFEKFTVADDSSTSKYGGTGLGLALSQKLCKLMGGEIFVESEFGKGSRFTIRVPLLSGRPKGDVFASATLVPAASDFASETTDA